MSTLINNLQVEDFFKMSIKQLAGLRPCEVFQGDDYLFTFIPANPFDGIVATTIRIKAEQLAVRSASVYPLERQDIPPEQPVVSEVAAFVCNECNASFDYKIALIGHQKKHKKEAVVV